MKKREKKALELVDDGKQTQFEDIPEGKLRKKKEVKRNMGRNPPTYWRCKNNHVFEVKHRIHPTREEILMCLECGAKVENVVNKSTYMDYLNKHGRGNKKQYINRFGKKEG